MEVYFLSIILYDKQNYLVSEVVFVILQLGGLRFRELRQLAQSQANSMWQSQDSSPLIAKFVHFFKKHTG